MSGLRLAAAALLFGAVACERSDDSADEGPGSTAAIEPLTAAAPHDSLIPDDFVGAAIRRGRAILSATGDSLPEHVGNQLRCTNCHFENGTRANVMPWIGVYGQFPQYRARAGGVQIIEDRINDCFERSMNGKALPQDSRAMRDIIAYMAFMSRNIPVGSRVKGQGLPAVAPLDPDTARGAVIYESTCSRCHGAMGEGGLGPPVWGAGSYNIGAGMARVRTAAAFVRVSMPHDKPGSLTDQQAYDVAAYINSRPRPDFPGKEKDWPNGDPPPDAAYPTSALAGKP